MILLILIVLLEIIEVNYVNYFTTGFILYIHVVMHEQPLA